MGRTARGPQGWDRVGWGALKEASAQCIGPVRGLPSGRGTEIGVGGAYLDGAIPTRGLDVWFEKTVPVRHFVRADRGGRGRDEELT
jgi:hypothetical protein